MPTVYFRCTRGPENEGLIELGVSVGSRGRFRAVLLVDFALRPPQGSGLLAASSSLQPRVSRLVRSKWLRGCVCVLTTNTSTLSFPQHLAIWHIIRGRRVESVVGDCEHLSSNLAIRAI
jgi:hypothetical protein